MLDPEEKRVQLSLCLHTALRKLCDSKITSLLWNFFYLIDSHADRTFHNHVLRVLEARDRNEEFSILNAVKMACFSLDYMGNQHLTILHCAFSLFSEEDWQNYVRYLEKDPNV